jgi:NAD(P)-dependent dehydrogenase (short-subunit alcohol dehydrogenase family)
MMAIKGQLVLVTGAAGAVGSAVVRAVELAGGHVLATDNDEDRLKAIGSDATERMRVDVTEQDDWVAVAGTIRERGRPLVGLVTCAAVFDDGDGDLTNISDEAWQTTLAINAYGVLTASRMAVPLMATHGKGSIVHVSSVVASRSSSTAQLAYTASKGAVSAMSRELAVAYATQGIRVNSIGAGLLDTPMTSAVVSSPTELARRLTHIPLGRLGRPDEVAAACSWLLSDASSYVTGTELMVDGGLSSAFVTGREFL